VATNGPTVRPVWYLWEESVFWILTGPWAQLARRVRQHPELALTVDVCDLETGVTRQVIARGVARVVPFDVGRGRRLLARYLGDDEAQWDPRFGAYLHDDPAVTGTEWIRVEPASVRATDLSFRASRHVGRAAEGV
jgi:Pyridoxamine 5'-phosphate oxidase